MTANPKSRGINKIQNPVDRLTEILIRKQLEQVDKVQQKDCAKEITGQKKISKSTCGRRNIQIGKSYSRLLGGSNNSSIYFIDENNESEHLKVASSNNLKMQNVKMKNRGEMERLKTMNVTMANDSRQTTEMRRASKNLIKRVYHETNLQRNGTFINSSSLRKDDTILTDDLKVTKVRLVRSRSELEVKRNDDNNSTTTSSNNNNNSNINSNSFSQPSCGEITASIKQSPRQQNHCLRSKDLGKLQLPGKTTRFGGTSEFYYSPTYWSYDIDRCFAKLSMSKRPANNYETKVKDFCKSLKKILQESTTDGR